MRNNIDIESAIREIFQIVFQKDEKEINQLRYGIYPWDSLAHMNIVTSIEEEFEVFLKEEDILELISLEMAIEIIKEYQVKLP